MLIAVTAPNGGDTFGALLKRHRRQIQWHCNRMVGSLEDSEDLGGETILRAWCHRTQPSISANGVEPAWRGTVDGHVDVLAHLHPRATMT